MVIGQAEEKPEFVLPKIPYEIISDLDAQRSGIIVYLGEKRNFALRINYEDGTQAALPPKVGELVSYRFRRWLSLWIGPYLPTAS